MAKTLAQVQADVAAQQTVTAGAVALIQGLQQQIQLLSTQGGATPDQLDALDQEISANTQALADAVAAGTGAPGATGSAGASVGAAGGTGPTGGTGATGN